MNLKGLGTLHIDQIDLILEFDEEMQEDLAYDQSLVSQNVRQSSNGPN